MKKCILSVFFCVGQENEAERKNVRSFRLKEPSALLFYSGFL